MLITLSAAGDLGLIGIGLYYSCQSMVEILKLVVIIHVKG